MFHIILPIWFFKLLQTPYISDKNAYIFKDYMNSVNSRRFTSDLFHVILTIKTSEVALYKKCEMSQSVSLSVGTYIHFLYQL